jgi:hypothetical protein
VVRWIKRNSGRAKTIGTRKHLEAARNGRAADKTAAPLTQLLVAECSSEFGNPQHAIVELARVTYRPVN